MRTKILIRIAIGMWIIISIFAIIGSVNKYVKKHNGTYTTVQATVTYTHRYYGRRHTTLKNGYISWEYDGIKHNYEDEKTTYLKLETTNNEGDVISIWVDSEDGRFIEINSSKQKVNNIMFIICLLVIDAVTIIGFIFVKFGKNSF